MSDKRIVAFEPWTASGPGWANQGVTWWYENNVGERWTETEYVKDGKVDVGWLKIAVIAFDRLKRQREEG